MIKNNTGAFLKRFKEDIEIELTKNLMAEHCAYLLSTDERVISGSALSQAVAALMEAERNGK